MHQEWFKIYDFHSICIVLFFIKIEIIIFKGQ